MRIVRNKLECLQFTPDEELWIQDKDDEDTFVNLLQMCSISVRYKIQKAKNQNPVVAKIISTKRREIIELEIIGKTGVKGAESK